MGKGILRARQANADEIFDAQSGRSEWKKTAFHLLWYQVVLLAMKHGRAPLPVSHAVWKGLQRHGVLNDLCDLGTIARRLWFLGDERLLLEELKLRTFARSQVEQCGSKRDRDQPGGPSVVGG